MNDTSIRGLFEFEDGTTTFGHMRFIPSNAGFVVFVGPEKWLKCVDGPAYVDAVDKATRWPTRKAAERALRRAKAGKKRLFPGAQVVEVSR